MDLQYYWHIELYSGEIIKVRPKVPTIKLIQDAIAKQEGAITTQTRSIVVKDIKDFRLSDELYTTQKLLEGAAQAFQSPLRTGDDSIKARWVKKQVPRRRWDTHYRHIPSYHLLEEGESYTTIGYKLPVHQINYKTVQDCDVMEIAVLEKNI